MVKQEAISWIESRCKANRARLRDWFVALTVRMHRKPGIVRWFSVVTNTSCRIVVRVWRGATDLEKRKRWAVILTIAGEYVASIRKYDLG